MKLDYSPAELAPRRSARRSILVASTCVVLLAAVATREGIAKRQSALHTEQLPAELASMLGAVPFIGRLNTPVNALGRIVVTRAVARRVVVAADCEGAVNAGNPHAG